MVAKMTVEVKGLKGLQKKLSRFGDEGKTIIEDTMWDWGQDTRATLKGTKYPPKPTRSRYRRTGRLANSWAVVRKGIFVIAIRNPARVKSFYARYVVGLMQTSFHKANSWWLAVPIVQKRSGKLVKAMAANFHKYMKKRQA